MTAFRRLSIVEQTLEYFREGLRAGRWKGHLPGSRHFEKELDVSKATVLKAFALLEKEGWLKSTGDRRRLEIVGRPPASGKRRKLRVVILLNAPLEAETPEYMLLIVRIRTRLMDAGHECEFSRESQESMKNRPDRIIRFVESTPADAWIVIGATEPVLKWFSSYAAPVMTIAGAWKGLDIASVNADASPGLRQIIRKLIALGHTRIVFVYPSNLYFSRKSYGQIVFGEELAAAGIKVGAFNLPEWDGSPTDYNRLLRSLFAVTPPTALVLYASFLTASTLLFLAEVGLSVPGDVSLVVLTDDAAQSYCVPPVSCLRLPSAEIERRVARWADGVTKGRVTREQVTFPAKFKPGGTIGPVRRGK